MWPDRVSNPGSNPGPLTYKSGALPTALHGPADKIVPVPCLRKDLILESINSEEKWFLSRSGTWNGLLIERVCCWGRCHVEGHCLSVCFCDCRLVDLCHG